jgi:hypothetical protein
VNRPTLVEIRAWPATVGVPVAATAYGFSRSHAYDLVARGEFPARVIKVARRYVVVTADIIRQLSATEQATDAA